MTPTDSLSVLIIVIFFIAAITIFGGGMLFNRLLQRRQLRDRFFSFAQERGLSTGETGILWDYSNKTEVDPMLILEFKSPFEKVVDLYVKTDGNADEKLVQTMRKKLGFNNNFYFIPLSLTKDIELYQSAKVAIDGRRVVDAALYDKDEKYMHWLLLDIEHASIVPEKSRIKITFLREGDAIYAFGSQIERIIQDRHKTIIKIPHTFELTRNQRRELSRASTDMPAFIGVAKETEGDAEIIWYSGRIVDISAMGAKFRIPPEMNEEYKIKLNEELEIKFEADKNQITSKAKIVSVGEEETATYIGLEFLDMKDALQGQIFKYVLNEQKKLVQFVRSQKSER